MYKKRLECNIMNKRNEGMYIVDFGKKYRGIKKKSFHQHPYYP